MSDNEAVRFEIAKLDVKAGDIIVLRARFRSAQDVNWFRDDISSKFPDLRFMVLSKDIELSVLAPEAIDGTDG